MGRAKSLEIEAFLEVWCQFFDQKEAFWEVVGLEVCIDSMLASKLLPMFVNFLEVCIDSIILTDVRDLFGSLYFNVIATVRSICSK